MLEHKIPGQEDSGESRDRLGRTIIESGILALLILSPLPAASTDDWAILIIELTAIALTVVYFLLEHPPQINAKLAERNSRLKYGLAAFFLWVGIQILPLPKFLVSILSPRTVALHQQFSPRFANLKFFSLSLVRSQTLGEALELISYVLIAFLIVKTITHRRQIQRMMTVIVAMGLFEALYGIFELYQKNPRVLIYKKIFNLDSATGTFINRNHFSGYLEMIIPLAVSLAIFRMDFFGKPGKKWRDRLSAWTGKKATSLVFAAVALVIMSLGIVLSNSRSGVFLLLLTFVIGLELATFHFSWVRRRQVWIRQFLMIVFVIITVSALYVGIDAMLGRFAHDNLLHEGRPQMWGNVLTIIRDFPLFGTGLGTFASVYPVYATVKFEGMALVHAHNDYLEYLAELGFVGFFVLAGVVLFVALDSFLTWSKRRNPEIKGLAMGGIISVFMILVHSLTDFNLHIPANTLLFSVVLALTYVTVYHRKS
jgi:O-antigen ligase